MALEIESISLSKELTKDEIQEQTLTLKNKINVLKDASDSLTYSIQNIQSTNEINVQKVINYYVYIIFVTMKYFIAIIF